jgi:arsenate reductase
MNKTRVLFLCIHNSARSQMAETFLNNLAGDRFEAESAGFEPRQLNPFVVETMQEIGYDISGNKSKDVFDLYKQGKIYKYVISVCDEGSAQKCPIFSGMMNRLAWSFSDPSSFIGSRAEQLEQTRNVRDAIKQKVLDFINIEPPQRR